VLTCRSFLFDATKDLDAQELRVIYNLNFPGTWWELSRQMRAMYVLFSVVCSSFVGLCGVVCFGFVTLCCSLLLSQQLSLAVDGCYCDIVCFQKGDCCPDIKKVTQCANAFKLSGIRSARNAISFYLRFQEISIAKLQEGCCVGRLPIDSRMSCNIRQCLWPRCTLASGTANFSTFVPPSWAISCVWWT